MLSERSRAGAPGTFNQMKMDAMARNAISKQWVHLSWTSEAGTHHIQQCFTQTPMSMSLHQCVDWYIYIVLSLDEMSSSTAQYSRLWDSIPSPPRQIEHCLCNLRASIQYEDFQLDAALCRCKPPFFDTHSSANRCRARDT
jgi:hypothetical protein